MIFMWCFITTCIYCGIIIACGGPMIVALRQPFPTNLHPYEPIYNHFFNIYENFPDYTTKEITSPRSRKILATHVHWPPWIKTTPKYCLNMDIIRQMTIKLCLLVCLITSYHFCFQKLVTITYCFFFISVFFFIPNCYLWYIDALNNKIQRIGQPMNPFYDMMFQK